MLDEDDQQEFAEYRMSPSSFYTGVVCTIFFLIVDIASVIVVLSDIDGEFPRPVPMAIFFGAFWTTWVLIGIYSIVAHFQERLILETDTVTQKSVITKKSIHLHQISGIEWRLLPQSGIIKVHSNETKFRIHTSNFLKQDRTEIIEYFRSSVAEELQTGWEESQERIAKFKPTPTEFVWRSYAMFAALFFVSSTAPIYLWTFDFEDGGYLLGIAAACVALGIASLVGSILHYRKVKNTPDEPVKS